MDRAQALSILQEYGYKATLLQDGIWRVSRHDEQGTEVQSMITVDCMLVALARTLEHQRLELSEIESYLSAN